VHKKIHCLWPAWGGGGVRFFHPRFFLIPPPRGEGVKKVEFGIFSWYQGVSM
jgi:hypothetical protein